MTLDTSPGGGVSARQHRDAVPQLQLAVARVLSPCTRRGLPCEGSTFPKVATGGFYTRTGEGDGVGGECLPWDWVLPACLEQTISLERRNLPAPGAASV